MDGDLIIAVDDRRVRTEHDVEAALDRLRPGDTTYITVIRPVVGGGHRTMRVALHIDQTIKAPPD
jgi:S1-C subfamily serine protease